MPFKFGDKKGYYDANEAGGNSRAPAFGSGDGGYYGNTGPRDYDNNMNQNYGGGAPGAFGGNPMGGRNFGNRQYPADCYGMNRRNSGSSDSDHSDRGEGYRRGSSKNRNRGGFGISPRRHSGDRHSSSDEGKNKRWH
uniref:Uncharacterized protein n=1 Tax=Trichobilharzia regenti TaxID=157069 RepID=A0AA85JGS7_TRIRE|nr:unnamed protein product [Trichobilharzia regenti]